MSHCEQRTVWQREAVLGMIAGMVYGATNVLVGQPFDTVKTKMQTQSAHMSSKISMTDSARRIMFKEGLQGFYRGAGVITAGTML